MRHVSLDLLPEEIFDAILSYLRLSCLRGLNLTCTSLHRRTVKTLWTSVSLSLLRKESHGGFFSACKHRADVREAIRCVNLVDDRSRPKSYEKVDSGLLSSFYFTEDRTLATRVWRTVSCLPSINTLRTIAPSGDATLLRPSLNLHGLETLRLSYCELSDLKLGVLLSKTPNLKHLRVDIFRLIRVNAKNCQSHSRRSVRGQPVLNTHDLMSALSNVQATLRTLVVSVSSMPRQHLTPAQVSFWSLSVI